MDLNWWDCQLRLKVYTFYPKRQEFISLTSRFDEWVCVVPEEGRFEFEVDKSESEIEHGEASFGDLVFARPGGLFNRHATLAPLVYHVLQWSFVIPDMDTTAVWQAGRWPVRDRARLTSTLSALRPLFGYGDAWSTRRREHLLEELLHLAWTGRQKPTNIDPLMSEAALLLRERAGDSLGMSEISQSLGLGPVQFTRRFRTAFNVNPIEYLTQIRLENAQKLLIETTLPLDHIATSCGWASGAYLSYVFERHYKLTPGRFRQQHRV